MTDLFTQEQIDDARQMLKNTPRGVAAAIARRIENERQLPPGSILNGRSRMHIFVVARHDTICETYLYFDKRGRHLSFAKMGQIFGRHFTSIKYALRKRRLI